MRILHLTTFLQGGAGRAITSLATCQRRAGHEVTLVASRTGVPGYGNYPSYLDELAGAGVVVLLVDSMFAREWAANLHVVRALESFIPHGDEPDVIHAHAAVPGLVGLVFAGTRRAAPAIVQTMHGWGIAKTPEQAAADVAVLNLLDAVAVPSRHARAQLEGLGVPRDRMAVIDYGIDQVTGPVADERVVSRLRDARARGALAVICLGTLGPRKNQRLLVEAVARLRGRMDVHAVIVGDGLAQPLVDAVDRFGVKDAVDVFGLTPNARTLVREADALVLPSRNEGQPLAVLEAFAGGVPVVVSNTPELCELVEAGDTGLHFAAEDAASLADALARLEAMPALERRRMGERGRALHRTRFTTSRMAAAYERFYRGPRSLWRGTTTGPAWRALPPAPDRGSARSARRA